MYQPDFLQTDSHVPWAWGAGNQVWGILEAARQGDTVALREMLDHTPDLIRCECEYRTPLHFAVRENQIEAVQWLLDRGADAVCGGYGGWHDRPLTMARERGFDELGNLLENHLRDHWNICPAGDETGQAIRDRDDGAAKQQVTKHGIGIADSRGNQPIHWAVMTRNSGLIDWLLQQGASINAVRPDGARPLDLTNGDYWYRGWRDLHPAAPGDHWQIMDYLIRQGAEYDLTTACRRNDMERVCQILTDDPQAAVRDANYITWYSGYPLRSACKGGFLEIAKLLRDHGADPNRPEHGLAPWGGALYDAVQNRHADVVHWLLEQGADPNQEVESSGNCYWQADENLKPALRARGALYDLYQCVHEGYVDDLKTRFQADPHQACHAEMFAVAAARGHREITDEFLRYQPRIWEQMAAVVTTDGGGRLVASEFSPDSRSGDVNRASWLGVHRLHHGCPLDELAVWVRLGVNLDLVDEEHRSTPLGWAARRGDLEFAQALIQAGADPHAAGAPWATPLAWARRRGHPQLAEMIGKLV